MSDEEYESGICEFKALVRQPYAHAESASNHEYCPEKSSLLNSELQTAFFAGADHMFLRMASTSQTTGQRKVYYRGRPINSCVKPRLTPYPKTEWGVCSKLGGKMKVAMMPYPHVKILRVSDNTAFVEYPAAKRRRVGTYAQRNPADDVRHVSIFERNEVYVAAKILLEIKAGFRR